MAEPSSEVTSHPRRVKRILIWCFLGLSLAAAGFLYVHFWVSRPIGSGPAGPAVSREAFAKVWTTRPTILLGLGDSVTAGFGASRGHGYFDRLISNPADEFSDMVGVNLKAVLPILSWTNLAMSGSTSLEHWGRQIPRLPSFSTNTLGLVVVTTGGNDLIHNYGRAPAREGAMFGAAWSEARPWLTNFAQRLDAMVRRIEEKFPGGCHIFLANIYDPTDGEGDIEHAGLPKWRDGLAILKAYNDTIAHCASTHPSVHLVNLHDAFLGHGIHCTKLTMPHYHGNDPHYWFYDNLEDPNDRGYDAIRRLFLIEMAKVLGQ